MTFYKIIVVEIGAVVPTCFVSEYTKLERPVLSSAFFAAVSAVFNQPKPAECRHLLDG